MKNNPFVILACLLITFCWACSEPEVEVNRVLVSTEVEVSEINPNGDSELALLMRKMYDDADTIKQQIIAGEGNITEAYIADLKRVHSAIPTDPDVKTDEFMAFNQLLIDQAETLKGSDNRIEGFNQLVNLCVNCHQTVCPGPISKIKKLTIINSAEE